VFRIRQYVGSPVQSMTAVVDGATRFRGIMNSAEILPFGRAHLRASRRRASGCVGKKRGNDGIDLLN